MIREHWIITRNSNYNLFNYNIISIIIIIIIISYNRNSKQSSVHKEMEAMLSWVVIKEVFSGWVVLRRGLGSIRV